MKNDLPGPLNFTAAFPTVNRSLAMMINYASDDDNDDDGDW